jgi:hypothetical protein
MHPPARLALLQFVERLGSGYQVRGLGEVAAGLQPLTEQHAGRDIGCPRFGAVRIDVDGRTAAEDEASIQLVRSDLPAGKLEQVVGGQVTRQRNDMNQCGDYTCR